ncbi:haloacid dehalogenase-like hydrolase [Acidiferrimicrobium sp. IK]|uniref:HAD family hydrolase n=1 Tax=Acidiferrimicrobium sp. IK TaxID=2871700 RepID=UPI0021CAFDF2|nr:HAD hydrolase-like protein [Acidiferrimicrobium sp. IK]MCU4186095.1 haloacid dehalogenase-like hydrolase [Acidiferrimicrobium sp. IK]
MLRRLLLWDIDGTLVRAGELGALVFDQALEDVFGRRPETRVRMSGKTDPQIVREYLALMHIAEEEHHVPAVVGHLERRMAAAAEELRANGTICPGVDRLLAAVAADRRILSSVLTGNIAPNAVVKLAAFGLDRWLDLEVGAYGSDHADRRMLVPVAMTRAATSYSARFTPDDVWVIGDSERDLACAQAGGAHCLLVGTGRTPAEELAVLGADAAVDDLSDTDGILKLLTAGLD